MNEEKEEVPMIEQYKVETALVHSSKTRKAALIISILATICIICSIIGNVVVVDIFTTKYNARTKDWIELAKALITNQTTITEVTNESTGEIQQLSLP